MDQEISKGTWIGATILAIVAILALAFAVYGISRSLVNNSSADFVSTVDDVSTSSFNDFDDTVVSGLQVRSAIDTYEGDKIMFLVNTAGVEEAFKKPGAPQSSAALVRKEQPADTNVDVLIKFGPTGSEKTYVVYNAIPDYAAALASGSGLKPTSAGYLQYEGMFKVKANTSDIYFNALKTNYKTTGCSEFIATGSNFNAKLIKDASGTVIGVMFSQVY